MNSGSILSVLWNDAKKLKLQSFILLASEEVSFFDYITSSWFRDQIFLNFHFFYNRKFLYVTFPFNIFRRNSQKSDFSQELSKSNQLAL